MDRETPKNEVFRCNCDFGGTSPYMFLRVDEVNGLAINPEPKMCVLTKQAVVTDTRYPCSTLLQ